MALPSEISKQESEDIFSKLYNSFYERQRSKAVTKIKNCKIELGAIIFKCQFDYLKGHPETKHKADGFDYKEAIDIYNDVLQGNY